MTEFETKDSGERQQWASGMQRDVQIGKPRFALMWTKRQPYDEQMVTRYAKLLARGAEKYDDRNWEEGCGQAELDYAMESLGRHTAQLICGETDEDHAAAVWFNTQLIEYIRWRMAQGKKKGKRNGSAKRRRKAKAKELLTLTESEINRRGIQRAAELRRRERIAESAKDFFDGETELSVEVNDVPAEAVRAAFGGSNQGAVGLFQFMPGGWPHSLFVPHGRPTPDAFRSQQDRINEMLKRYRDTMNVAAHRVLRSPHPSQISKDGKSVTFRVQEQGDQFVVTSDTEEGLEAGIASVRTAERDAGHVDPEVVEIHKPDYSKVTVKQADLYGLAPTPEEEYRETYPDENTTQEPIKDWPDAKFQKGDAVQIEQRWFSLQPNPLKGEIEAYLPKSSPHRHLGAETPRDQYLVRILDAWYKGWEIVDEHALSSRGLDSGTTNH